MGSSQKQLDMKKVPVIVTDVHFEGVKATSGSLLVRQARQLFTDVSNFEDLIASATNVRDRISALDVFSDVQYVIDTTDKGKNGYSVTYEVKERSRLNLSLTTMTSMENKPSLVIRGRALNFTGSAEQLEANVHFGTSWDVRRYLTLTLPLFAEPRMKSRVGVFDESADLSWLRIKDSSSGAFFGVEWPTFAGRHDLRMEACWRQLSTAQNSIPLSIRGECGHYLRALLRHTYEKDTQDCRFLPSRGWLARMTQEFATGGGGFQETHMKHEIHGQWSIPVHENEESGSCISFQLNGGCGVMKSLPGSGRISVVDRFFIGGALGLRGFELHQIGDRTEDGSCPTGALAYTQFGAHLYSTLPWLSTRGILRHIRLHAFSTGACLARREPPWTNRTEMMSLFSRESRLSSGLGVVVRLGGMARFEVNYCWPLLSRCGDRTKPGLQFGIGLQYL